MGLKYIIIVVVLAFNRIRCDYSSGHILSCNMSDINACKGNKLMMCNETTLECNCAEGFVPFFGGCALPITPEDLYGPTTPIIIIFALALLVSGLVLVIRKYKLVDYIRQKINQRRNNDVMYEDVMIGNDDPPLTP